jgi:hypothetical protein
MVPALKEPVQKWRIPSSPLEKKKRKKKKKTQESRGSKGAEKCAGKIFTGDV